MITRIVRAPFYELPYTSFHGVLEYVGVFQDVQFNACGEQEGTPLKLALFLNDDPITWNSTY